MSASLSWDSVPDAVTDVYVSVSDGRVYRVPAPLSSLQVSGLRNGTSYEFIARAATADGVGPAESVRAVPLSGLEGEVAGLVVKFEPGVTVTDGQESVPGEAAVLQADLTADTQVADGVRRVELSHPVSRSEAQDIARELTADPAVAWAEPDGFVTMSADSGAVLQDADYAQQWNLWDAYGVGVGMGTAASPTSSAYADGQGEGATVAVIDTGITAHPDLDAQLLPGYDFVSSPSTLSAPREYGVPNAPFDGDSVDAAKFGPLGWDDNPTDPGDWRGTAPARNSSWHGTHVAGVIAAQPNTQGVAGLAPKAKILPIRALSWRGGLMSDVAASITWATGGTVDGVAVNPNPADVVNLSFAMTGLCPASLQAAIDGANARGAVVVAAAGNANDDVANWAPANCTGVIAVGATGRDGKRAPYSNWGAGIDVSAPGGSTATDGGVLSTSNAGLTGAGDAAYATQEGTSVAAAHVSAIAARIAGADQQLTPEQITTRITGRSGVRAFAGGTCDTDPARTCGTGIAQIAAVSDQPGVDVSLTVDSALVADGSTIANGTTVGVGTAGLLSPGYGPRTLETQLDSKTVYVGGSAVAPEGWTIEYSTNNGGSWSSSQPTPASGVTNVRARANASAGAIEGTSQVYSTETTSTVPSSSFSASTGGDGWGTTFYDDYIFNVFHHDNGNFRLACHVRSTGQRCPAFSGGYVEYSGYRAAMRSDVAIDQSTGLLYGFTSPTSGTYANRAGLLCLDVSNAGTSSSAPTSCGFIPLSTSADVTDYGYLSDLVTVGRRIFGVESAGANSLLCFDPATGAACPNSPVAVEGDSGMSWGSGGSRPIVIGNRILVRTSTKIYCFIASDLSRECDNAARWPVSITSNTTDPQFAVHTTADGNVDGVCSLNECFDLTGRQQSWTNPFTLGTGGNQWAYTGVTTVGRFFWSVSGSMNCFDFATNAACANWSSPGWRQLYSVEVDPQNPACLWTNSDEGAIKIIDAFTGATNCAGNPVITLQPSQFAPRYACSTTQGITNWTTLTLQSLTGGGTPATTKLTIRDGNGDAVAGWTNRTVTVGSPIDMTGLDPSVTSSRPTFSFAFSNVTGGSITQAVISLDYKGKGPELCVDTIVTGTNGQTATVNGTLTESVGAPATFGPMARSFTIGTTRLVSQTVPGAPVNLRGSGMNTTADLRFEAPASDGGSPITGYQVSTTGGSTWSDATTSLNGDGSFSTTIRGLSAGVTYDVRVAAVNALGRGSSASVSLTTQRLSIDSLTDTPVNEGPLALATQTDDGLPLTYSVAASSSSVCSVTGASLSLLTQGTCAVTASQEGDPSRGILAANTSKSFTVLPASIVYSAPSAPGSLTATRGNGQVSLAWSAPFADGNSPITDYLIQYKTGSTWITFVDGVSANRTALVTGLVNGTAYSFRVAAVNAIGTGAYSATATATPATVPGSPTSLAASGSGTSRSLSWTAPASTGGSAITDYTVEYKLSTAASWSAFADGTSTSTSVTVTGLSSSDDYDFRVTTVNAVGSSTPTSTVNLSVTAGAAQVILAWEAPASPGGTIVDYRPQYRLSGDSSWSTFADAVSASTGSTVTGLTNGTAYDFRVATVVTNPDPRPADPPYPPIESVSSYTSVVTATPADVPGEVTPLTATAGANQVALSWSAPAENGSAITDYVVEYKTSAGSSWSTFTDGVSTGTSATVTGLFNGTAYDFRVSAVNGKGTGATTSPAASATPRTTPTAPGTPTTSGGSGQISLTWTAPASTGGAAITSYVIEYKTSAAVNWTTWAPGTPITGLTGTVTGLVNGTAYNFRVAAVNAAGTGTPSTTVNATPPSVPGTPVMLTASAGDGRVTLSWGSPINDGGSAITDYAVQYRPASSGTWLTFADGVSTSQIVTVTGLVNGTSYNFRVAAVNAIGTGSSTSSVSGTPSALPSAPRALTVTTGDESLVLSWTAPASDGGTAITDYIVQVRASAAASWTTFADGTSTGTTATITGLTNGTAYEVRIAAVNAAGTSSYTTGSGTPMTVPDQPTSVSGSAGTNQVALTWTAPLVDGGSAITDYTIEYQLSSASSWSTFTHAASTAVSATVTGLWNGSTYRFRVSAVNAVGASAVSNTATVSLANGVSLPPTGLTATDGTTTDALSWTAPANNGGSSITDYVVEYRVSGAVAWTTFNDGTSTSTTATVTGLTTGTTYEFQVSAVNGYGRSSGATTTGTPFSVPGAPTSLTATGGPSNVALSWTAAQSNGRAVTDYVIEVQDPDTLAWTQFADGTSAATTATVTGLVVGLEYGFRVSAVNSAGTGAPSAVATGVPTAAATSGSPLASPSEPTPAPTRRRTVGPLRLQTPLVSLSLPVPETTAPVTSLPIDAPLQATQGSWIEVSGDGYARGSTVSVWLIPRPTARSLEQNPRVWLLARVARIPLGVVSADENGRFTSRVSVPSSIDTGNYVLRLEGVDDALDERALEVDAVVTAKPKMPVMRRAFFEPRSQSFSPAGKRKLAAVAATIAGADGRQRIEITGVSVSMTSLERNVKLAAARATKITRYLRAHGVTGEYVVRFVTSMDVARARHMKPLSTVEVTFNIS